MLWNPLSLLQEKILGAGGFVNAHAHLDRAYSVTPADIKKNMYSPLHAKWEQVDAFKTQSTQEAYYHRMEAALRQQKAYGVSVCLSFVDCDPVSQDRAWKAALEAKRYASEELHMRFLVASQTLKGVLQPKARFWLEKALPHVDIIGGLPGADKGREAEHLDVLLQYAKETGKRVHVHVDQLNTPDEKETELLARKTMAFGLEGRVTAVHGISIGAHKQAYRKELYQLCQDAGLSFVACPTAWIDSRRSERETPTHNAITPIDEMIPAGLVVALGSDNICDVYKPFANGDPMVELRVLLEASHVYDMEELVRLATDNGRFVLGLL